MLKSWAVPRGLPTDSRHDRLAVQVGDHDLDHATYTDEHKFIADAGWWELEDRTAKRFVFVLHGRDGARRYAMITTDPDTNDRLLHLVKKQPDRWPRGESVHADLACGYAADRYRSTTRRLALLDATRSEVLDDPVDAGGEGLDVGGVDGGVHGDAELVAAELAVGLGVDDAVGAQGRGDGVGGDRVVEVDGADDEGAVVGVGDVRRGVRRSSRPTRTARRTRRWCARPCRRGRPGRSSSRAARPSGTASPPTGCCRSG